MGDVVFGLAGGEQPWPLQRHRVEQVITRGLTRARPCAWPAGSASQAGRMHAGLHSPTRVTSEGPRLGER
jgi:hypothetical protein